MRPNDGLNAERVWVVVPVFNNRETVRAVIAACAAVMPHVVAVDDGSTDADVAGLLAGLDITLLKHDRNRGKGAAILTASRFIEERGGGYMITLDADGQHDPADIRKFLPLLPAEENAVVVGIRDFNTGNVPASSRFGRAFANFWLRVETGEVLDDCQSGFRAYPVRHLNRLRFRGAHYDFEAEVLAKAAWAGLIFVPVGISVRYPKAEERVSSFRPFLDNLRLTHTHALLVLRRLLPWGHRRLAGEKKKADLSLLRHPIKFMLGLLREHATPEGLALAAAVGSFIAILPILFFHTPVILYVAIRLRLNKIMALNIQHLFMPPLMPALCIEVGYYFRFGRWLTDLSFESVFTQFSDRLYEWFLGSLIMAPLGAAVTGAAVFVIAAATKGRVREWIEKKTVSSREGIG